MFDSHPLLGACVSGDKWLSTNQGSVVQSPALAVHISKCRFWLQWGSAGSHSRRSWFLILFHGRSPPLCNCVSQFLIMFFDPYSDPWWQHATEMFKKEILTDLFCGSAWLLPLVEEFPWWQISQGALSRSMSSSVGFILKTPTMISHLVTRAVQYIEYIIFFSIVGKKWLCLTVLDYIGWVRLTLLSMSVDMCLWLDASTANTARTKTHHYITFANRF